MTDQAKQLEHDLSYLIVRYSDLTGREFQEICDRVARAYYEERDLHPVSPDGVKYGG
ncbi:hypothetical protein ACNFH8_25580 [Pseudomonas sp. NY15436]|uniref:hypothetical protein n=1 Tax=Pseudomonas sp. NY15436 TaxID=3400359 RepID=UPI003A891D01